MQVRLISHSTFHNFTPSSLSPWQKSLLSVIPSTIIVSATVFSVVIVNTSAIFIITAIAVVFPSYWKISFQQYPIVITAILVFSIITHLTLLNLSNVKILCCFWMMLLKTFPVILLLTSVKEIYSKIKLPILWNSESGGTILYGAFN